MVIVQQSISVRIKQLEVAIDKFFTKFLKVAFTSQQRVSDQTAKANLNTYLNEKHNRSIPLLPGSNNIFSQHAAVELCLFVLKVQRRLSAQFLFDQVVSV